MLSTVHFTDRVLPYPHDILHNIHDCAYVKFPIHRPTYNHNGKSNSPLPFDIKELVLKLLHSPRDLASLALTSKEWANTIIPDYLYRELNVQLTHGEIWKSLASRPMLAQRTQTLRLLEPACENIDNSTGPKNPDPSSIFNLSLALRNCSSLGKFCWTGFRRPLEVTQDLLEALALCPVLKEIDLGPVVLDQDDRSFVEARASLWKLNSLTTLILRGDWDRSCADTLYLSLIRNSPRLEELSILYGPASIPFTSCPLPKLRKLHLWHDSLYIQFPESEMYPYDAQIFTFLLNHPLIEDLRWLTCSWNLSGSPRLVAEGKFLPNLKRLDAHGQLYFTLLQCQNERRWESISRATLSTDLPILEKLDLTMLQEIRLMKFENFDTLSRLAGMAKNIVTLSIPGFGPPLNRAYQYSGQTRAPAPTMEGLQIEQYLNALSRFPRLESLLDTRLWASIMRLDPAESAKVISSLTTKCPKLHRLGHWDSLRHMQQEIIFERDVDTTRWHQRPGSEDNWERFGGV